MSLQERVEKVKKMAQLLQEPYILRTPPQVLK